jgi:hypothetical protein
MKSDETAGDTPVRLRSGQALPQETLNVEREHVPLWNSYGPFELDTKGGEQNRLLRRELK